MIFISPCRIILGTGYCPWCLLLWSMFHPFFTSPALLPWKHVELYQLFLPASVQKIMWFFLKFNYMQYCIYPSMYIEPSYTFKMNSTWCNLHNVFLKCVCKYLAKELVPLCSSGKLLCNHLLPVDLDIELSATSLAPGLLVCHHASCQWWQWT